MSREFRFFCVIWAMASCLFADDSAAAASGTFVDGRDGIKVGNPAGAALPHTGGLGTTMFYILGLLLTGLAGAGLVLSKRRAA